MDKRTFDKQFIESIAKDLEKLSEAGFLDTPAVRERYNIETDAMQKSGEITEKQRLNWCTPNGALSLRYLRKVKSNLK